MQLKRLLSMILSISITAGFALNFEMEVFAEIIHTNRDNYFYFCIEYTDYDGEEESRYYDGDYTDKCMFMNPIKIYEDGFYDYTGNFIKFEEIWGNLAGIRDNLVKANGVVDCLTDAVDLVLAYYNLGYEINTEIPMTEENNYDYDAIFLSDYAFLNGSLEQITVDLGMFDSSMLALFDGDTIANNDIGYYKWSNKTIESGDVFRVVCDWNGSEVLIDYQSPACDDLIGSMGDYYELRAENVDGIKNAEEAYTAALEGYFGDNTKELSANLKDILPKIQESEAVLGNVLIKSKNNEEIFVKGNTNAYLSVVVDTYVGNMQYQWYCDGEKISGANESLYYISNELSGKHTYKVDVTSIVSTNNKVTKSAEKEITIYDLPTVSVNSEQKVFSAVNTETVLTSYGVCDTENYINNTLSYQWYSAKYADDYKFSKKLDGETDKTLKITHSKCETNYYYVKVTDSGKNVVNSEIIEVTVIPTYDINGWDGRFDDDDEPEFDYETLTYKIGSPSQLAWYADYVNSTVKTSATQYCDIYSAELIDDIDLNSYPWIPINSGTDKTPVNFTFDGKGHTIKNLYSNHYTSGLFGAVGYIIDEQWGLKGKYSYIKNLNIEGYSNGESYAALVAGKATNTFFENVTVNGKVGGEQTGYSGGVVGFENGCVFDNCINYADICANTSIGCAGGIAGAQAGTWSCVGGGVLRDNTKYLITSIKNCINVGAVSATKSGAMLGCITTYDNDYEKYDLYKYNDIDPDSFGYQRCVAVKFQNNITLNNANHITLSAKKDNMQIETARVVNNSECSEGNIAVDILSNELTVSNSTLSGKVISYINNKNSDVSILNAVMAIYGDDGRLIAVKVLPKKTEIGHNIITFNDIAENVNGYHKIKIMLWDNLNTIIPLSDSAEE